MCSTRRRDMPVDCQEWSKKKCFLCLVLTTVALVVFCYKYMINDGSYVPSGFSADGTSKSFPVYFSPSTSTEYGSISPKIYLPSPSVNATQAIKNVSHDHSCGRFLVYVYSSVHETSGRLHVISEVTSSLVKDLQLGDSWTDDPASACIFVVVVGLWRDTISSGDVSTMIHSLPHWKEYSHKHVLVELLYSNNVSRILQQIEADSALLAASYFTIQNADSHILIPPVVTSQVENTVIPPTGHLMSQKTSFSLYFEGELEDQQRSEADSKLFGVCEHFSSNSSCAFKCSASRERGALEREWSLCNTATERLAKCQKALCALVPCGMEGEVGPVTFTRLIEALQCGAVPIVVGDCVNRLPFSELIEWKEAAVFVLPDELSPDLIHNSQKNVRKYKERGLFLYKTYFCSGLKIVESLIAIVRNHSHHLPMWYRDYVPEMLLNTMPRNTLVSPPVQPQQLWNSPPGPLYRHTHIAEQVKYLENFTIVILTYHRVKGLTDILVRLKDCPYLDKVVIVWNNEPTYMHPRECEWPNIGVPIEVVRGEGNTLNNRFLPFSNIETEAILSLDDDVCLTQEEIVQGFRVWQMHRTTLVGWMSRLHILHVNNGQWSYQYDFRGKDCEYTMMMTNGAFFHKYYTFLYTYWMPERIRMYVRKNLNCEDIAMSFLIAHITRQPPVAIGGKRTPECKKLKNETGIHRKAGHLEKRHASLKEFESAYGYMPLKTNYYKTVGPWCAPK